MVAARPRAARASARELRRVNRSQIQHGARGLASARGIRHALHRMDPLLRIKRLVLRRQACFTTKSLLEKDREAFPLPHVREQLVACPLDSAIGCR